MSVRIALCARPAVTETLKPVPSARGRQRNAGHDVPEREQEPRFIYTVALCARPRQPAAHAVSLSASDKGYAVSPNVLDLLATVSSYRTRPALRACAPLPRLVRSS